MFRRPRNFGKLTVTLSYANYFNGVRFSADGTPQLHPHRTAEAANVFREYFPGFEPCRCRFAGVFLSVPVRLFRAAVFYAADFRK